MIKLKINSCDGVYDSLDVRFTKSCDNRCSFCIEKDGLKSLGETNVERMIEQTLSTGKKDILILGGEPLLLPEKVLQYIKGIRPFVDTIYLTTSLPKILETEENTEILKEIVQLLDGLNISIHHYKDEINNSVLNSLNPYNRIEYLSKILTFNGFAEKIRVCCNLVARYIDSKSEIDSFLSKMSTIGVKHVKLNELQNVDMNDYVSFEKEYQYPMKSPFAHGCQTDISDLFKQFNMKITLKRSCFCTQDIRIAKATISDFVKCVYKRFSNNATNCSLKVLYENGDVCNGWK